MHKVTSKRQVTIPQAICQVMSLNPGDYVEIFERAGIAHVVKMNTDTLAGNFQNLSKDKTFPETEAMKNAIKNRAASKFQGHDCD